MDSQRICDSIAAEMDVVQISDFNFNFSLQNQNILTGSSDGC